MVRAIETIYDGEAFRPVQPLTGLPHPQRVWIVLEDPAAPENPIMHHAGTLPPDVADAILKAIHEADVVNPDEWK